MKRTCSALFALLCCSLIPACSRPLPTRCVITPRTYVDCEPAFAPLAEYLAEYLPLKPATRGNDDNLILLALDTTLKPEAFRLEICPSGVAIKGADYGGVFNGIQALFRLMPAEIYTKQQPERIELPDTVLTDGPRFPYRGMMLDVARTWQGPDAVKRFIDLLAYHRINKLHLHLSDDEGWRIEIKSHPELTEIGGFRGGDSPVRAVYGKWDQKYGGYFTQEEMRDLIGYAAVRNIEIIPEIDLPGHSRNIASVHPEIRCNYPPDTLSTNGYDYRSAWCVARDANYTLLSEILGEICELFPSEYIHIGGDEVDFSQWKRCPDCQKLMRQRGMTDPSELEDHFMNRLTTILAAHGKRPGVWNEAAASGDFTHDCLVYGWQHVKACLDATSEGYRTVVMPGEYFYFDMRQTPEEDGHDWAAIFDAKKVYGFDFNKLGFSEEQMKHVAGLEGTFFSEAYVSHDPEHPDYLDYMCYPRICALAHIAWRGNKEGWDTFYRELVAEHYDRMAEMDIRFRLFPPKVIYRNGVFTVTTDDCSQIYYIKEGCKEEHRYKRPIHTDKPHLYRFYTRYRTAKSPYVADKSYYRTIAPALTITTSMGESSSVPYSNAETYRGLSRTRRACRQQDWICYNFSEPVRCREMFLQTGNRQLPKTIITTGYAEISYDGQTFERVGDLIQGSIMLYPDRPVKAVRIVSTCNDNGTPYVTIQPPRIKPVL